MKKKEEEETIFYSTIRYSFYIVNYVVYVVGSICYCHSHCIITIFERCLISFRVISHLNDLFTMKFNVFSEFWLMNQYIFSVTLLHWRHSRRGG